MWPLTYGLLLSPQRFCRLTRLFVAMMLNGFPRSAESDPVLGVETATGLMLACCAAMMGGFDARKLLTRWLLESVDRANRRIPSTMRRMNGEESSAGGMEGLGESERARHLLLPHVSYEAIKPSRVVAQCFLFDAVLVPQTSDLRHNSLLGQSLDPARYLIRLRMMSMSQPVRWKIEPGRGIIRLQTILGT